MMNPWLGITLVLAILAGVMTTLRWVNHRFAPHPEIVRKSLHLGMGLTTLTFPWLFDQSWPVLVLAGVTVPGLLLVRRSGRLKARLGGVIDGVQRTESLGEIYFPLGVAGLYLLSSGDPLRYTTSILLLTLADALAALIGIRYGQTFYPTSEGYKSIEGSLAFFTAAVVSVLVSLHLFSDLALVEVVLIAVVLSLLVMIVEAVAWRGLDNLLVPIVGFLLLDAFLNMTQGQLIVRLALAIGLITCAILGRKPDEFAGSAFVSELAGHHLAETSDQSPVLRG
jgi:phytol kinase